MVDLLVGSPNSRTWLKSEPAQVRRLAQGKDIREALFGQGAEKGMARKLAFVVAGLERPQRKRARWRGVPSAVGCSAVSSSRTARCSLSSGVAAGSEGFWPIRSGNTNSGRTARHGSRRSSRRATARQPSCSTRETTRSIRSASDCSRRSKRSARRSRNSSSDGGCFSSVKRCARRRPSARPAPAARGSRAL